MLTRTTFDVATRLASFLDATGDYNAADRLDATIEFAMSRTAANWLTNGYNAVELGLHGSDPLYLLGTMRVQIKNLVDTVIRQRGFLTPAVQSLAEQLAQNILGWLNSVQQDQFSTGGSLDQIGAQPSNTPRNARRTTHSLSIRHAGATGMIESNARAALGVLQYLDRSDLFPRGPQALKSITQDINALIAVVTGTMSAETLTNQININQQAEPEGSSERKVPGAELAEGVRQWLGKGTQNNTSASNSANPPYNREAHIQRYLQYARTYGYDAMIEHLKQHEGDAGFIAAVKTRAQQSRT